MALKIEKACEVCNKVFLISPWQIKIAKQCSRKCHGIACFKGRKQSDEHKKKKSLALKGRVFSKEHCEKIRLAKLGHKQSPEQIAKRAAKNRGQTRTEETKIKMSNSAKLTFIKGRTAKSGIEHYRWKGGISEENNKVRTSAEMCAWRIAVFRRDKYTCVICGNVSNNNSKKGLNADHIKPFSLFPELRFDVSNGRTLCIPCHKETPTYGNRNKFKREDFL